MGIADDPGDAGEGGEFFGGTLSVAASDDDAGGRIGSVELANGIAGLGVGCSGDGAGVDDDDVGVGGFGRRSESAIYQLALEGGAVGLGGAAAELFDVEGGHFAKHHGKRINTEVTEGTETNREKTEGDEVRAAKSDLLRIPALEFLSKGAGRENLRVQIGGGRRVLISAEFYRICDRMWN